MKPFMLTLLLLAAGVPGLAWDQAILPRAWSFPQDHGPHFGFATEWWYFTGHLASADGRPFGYELTFFRRGISMGNPPAGSSPWRAKDLAFAHFALSDIQPGRFRYFQRSARAALGMAVFAPDRVQLDQWSAGWRGDSFALRASEPGLALDLGLQSLKPAVLEGPGGVSQKGPARGDASYYYSLTRMGTRGTLQVDGKSYSVEGLSWMDHEFGSDQLQAGQEGWDWFSVQLEGGQDVMVYRIRGSRGDWLSGSFVDAGGKAVLLAAKDIGLTPAGQMPGASGARYPKTWNLRVEKLGLNLNLVPEFEDQELDTSQSTGVVYWEGAERVVGSLGGTPARGRAYVEMTGYAGSLKGKF